MSPVSLRVPSSWLTQDGKRLDATFYTGSGQKEARAFVASKTKKKFLCKLSSNGTSGIFLAGRFRRVYVEEPYGYPFVTGSGIIQANPREKCKYISQRYTQNLETLTLTGRTTVITRSGSIGNMVYTNEDLAGLVGSDDLIRVAPDPEKILPGYLYAFLSSKIGKALVTQNTYGSVIQHIEAHHLYDLPVPILAQKTMQEIHNLIEEAAKLRTEANQELEDINRIISEIIGMKGKPTIHGYSVTTVPVKELDNRLGGLFHSNWKRELLNKIKKTRNISIAEASTKIFVPPMFKHIYLEKNNGYPFIVGAELAQFEMSLHQPRYLSPLGVKDIKAYVIQPEWSLLYRHGQLNSMMGEIFYASHSLKGYCLSDLVIRIVPDTNKIDSGYLNAVLRSPFYNGFFKTAATGNMIPFISEHAIKNIPVPYVDKNEQKRIGDKLRDAFEKRDTAYEKCIAANEILEDELKSQ